MKKPRAPSLVTVAIMTTITIIFWVFFSVYRVLSTKIIPDTAPGILEPILVDLDSNTLAQIDKRVYFERGSIQQFLLEITPFPTLNKVESSPSLETTTPSAELEATGSGEL
ncbi:hypothetical protein A2Z22_04965 [Candidatus Woesebacteria bacterium RBG_16_34_12]|uniref:Uncharacterized protein n=1 Tax=Candidatus Woesebacteria bacterium RBG_16_34_12 TaxID=1802480 RepID=A0A1F7X9N1_9BACT|nr:MAG: hypothetical protein A2Z22_04965 [Candidatus Woesebacteria bacterium RBG_16_34_12]